MPARADLDPFRAHGGRVEAARVLFGGPATGGDWIDLSTGIAPWRYPAPPARDDRLPEPRELADLEAAAAEAFAVPAGRQVVAVPGSDLALRLLATVLPGAAPAVVRPGYAGHAAAWPGATPTAADALVEAAMAHDVVVFASPANPDGRVADPALVKALATRVTVVADEAFADLAPGLASLDLGSQDDERLVVLRSFGKFYGLPGLRLGFVVCGTRVAAALRALLGDWPVSAAAIAAGRAAYRDGAWRAAQAARIAATGERLDALLARAGLAIVGGASLFRLVDSADADALFRHLAARAILTRPFADQPGRLRLGLPADDAALDRLAHALEEAHA